MSFPWASTDWAPARPQYASEYMDVTVWRDGFEYKLHFEKGENKTGTPEGFVKTPCSSKKTGTPHPLAARP